MPDTYVKLVTVPKLLSAREAQVSEKSSVELLSGCADLVVVIQTLPMMIL